jgi:hypothetical protein
LASLAEAITFRGHGTVASGPKVRLAGSKVEPLPVLRLPEVLKAVNLGIADGVQGLWWRTPV